MVTGTTNKCLIEVNEETIEADDDQSLPALIQLQVANLPGNGLIREGILIIYEIVHPQSIRRLCTRFFGGIRIRGHELQDVFLVEAQAIAVERPGFK